MKTLEWTVETFLKDAKGQLRVDIIPKPDYWQTVEKGSTEDLGNNRFRVKVVVCQAGFLEQTAATKPDQEHQGRDEGDLEVLRIAYRLLVPTHRYSLFSDIERTIFHELVHVEQIVSGELSAPTRALTKKQQALGYIAAHHRGQDYVGPYEEAAYENEAHEGSFHRQVLKNDIQKLAPWSRKAAGLNKHSFDGQFHVSPLVWQLGVEEVLAFQCAARHYLAETGASGLTVSMAKYSEQENGRGPRGNIHIVFHDSDRIGLSYRSKILHQIRFAVHRIGNEFRQEARKIFHSNQNTSKQQDPGSPVSTSKLSSRKTGTP